MAGEPHVLSELKALLGMVTADPDAPVVVLEPDRFRKPQDSPLPAQHAVVTAIFNAVIGPGRMYQDPRLDAIDAGKAVLALEPMARGFVLLAAAERHVAALLHHTSDFEDQGYWQSHYASGRIVQTLIDTPVQFERSGLFDFVLYLAVRPGRNPLPESLEQTMLAQLESLSTKLTGGERFVLHLWRASRIQSPPMGVIAEDIVRLTKWIGDRSQFFVVPGECWSDAVNADLSLAQGEARTNWETLLRHLMAATSARPSDRWKKSAAAMVQAIGAAELRRCIERWLPLVTKGRTLPKIGDYVGDTRGKGDLIHEDNATILRGLLWLMPMLELRDGLPRLAAAVALSAYKKVPGVGPRAVKVGNAAVYALSEMVSPESIGQLAMLKVRVRFGTAQKEIEKAFDAAAAALQLPRDQIEEMSVPACGLDTVGRRQETFGEYRAELTVTGSDAALKWFDGKGKQLKSAPTAVKRDDPDTLKELQQGIKDIDAMLTAQRDRIDAMFLEQKRWSVPVWRERYLDHPLVGTIARRLIWCVAGTAVTALDGEMLDVEGKAVTIPNSAEVTLWHPAGRGVDEVLAWRRRIESLEIVQPFKQAHREVYLLTDAELRTSTYSNRYAAHILRQHQVNALCGARRWKNKLRLMVDDVYPPASRDLPAWGLRAEFWIEGIGDNYGVDTNEAGVFLRLASDQVRFYRLGAAANLAHAGGGGYTTNAQGPGTGNINEPIPLDQVPPLVFSEIMRDVDLFVGVASIANDPTWQDGGAGGRYRDYWHGYAFGDLSETAQTRRDVLQRLVPRLKIANRCSFLDKFLVVRGDRRTYKIHLGSGNILMEPNDQYLCIVPDARARSGDTTLYLPFEGDSTLSIILSKAFLLADDKSIKDSTINRQIDLR
jgi:hypothetical protein